MFPNTNKLPQRTYGKDALVPLKRPAQIVPKALSGGGSMKAKRDTGHSH